MTEVLAPPVGDLIEACKARRKLASAKLSFQGKQVRRFVTTEPLVDDGTLRCFACGQIDDQPWHDPELCFGMVASLTAPTVQVEGQDSSLLPPQEASVPTEQMIAVARLGLYANAQLSIETKQQRADLRKTLRLALTGNLSSGALGTQRSEVDPNPHEAERRIALEVALLPFAEAGDELDDDYPDGANIWEHYVAMNIDAGHLRAARALLTTKTGE